MIRLLTVVAGIVTLATTEALAQRSIDAPTRAELIAAREAIWRAWFANDTVQLERLLPEAVVAGEGRGYQDRDAIMEGARRFAQAGGKLVGLQFSSTDIDVFGDVAVVRSVYRYETEMGGKRSVSSGRATEVFVRRDRKWLNPFWHLQDGD